MPSADCYLPKFCWNQGCSGENIAPRKNTSYRKYQPSCPPSVGALVRARSVLITPGAARYFLVLCCWLLVLGFLFFRLARLVWHSRPRLWLLFFSQLLISGFPAVGNL